MKPASSSFSFVQTALEDSLKENVRLDQYLIKNALISEDVCSSLVAKYLGYNYGNIDVIQFQDELIANLSLDFIEKNLFILLLSLLSIFFSFYLLYAF